MPVRDRCGTDQARTEPSAADHGGAMAGTGSNRRPCGFQPGAAIRRRSWWFGWAAFALISRGADRLVVQGDPGSCGSVQISWAEQRTIAPARRREGMPARGGSGAPHRGPCRGKADPRRLPPTSEPRLGDRLVRGEPWWVWARDIPKYRRLSLVSDVVPERLTCSNHAHGDGRPYRASCAGDPRCL